MSVGEELCFGILAMRTVCGGERVGLQRPHGGPEARVGLGGDFRGLLAVRGVLLREVAVRAGRDGVPRVWEGAA